MTEEQKAELQKHLEDSLNFAEGIRDFVEVATVPFRQAGQDNLLGKCPRCGHKFALSGEGKHPCPRCGQWCKFLPPE